MRGWLTAGTVAGLAIAVALTLVRDRQDWNFSEGVYVLTSHLFLHGGDLYGHIVVAQPPVMPLVGAGILALSDTLDGVRLGVALFALAGGVLAAGAVWRLTRSGPSTAATVPLSLLMPWAVQEHGLLTPEMVALPALLGSTLLAARAKRAGWAGVALSLATFIKVPFAAAAVLVTWASARRARTLVWLAAGLGAQATLFTLVFGSEWWGDAIVAQVQTGRHGVGYVARLAVQAGWNLLGLLAGCALLAWRLRQGERAADELQLRTSAALALACLLTLVTLFKQGTFLNTLVPVEFALLPLTVTGWWMAWRASSGLRRSTGAWRATLLRAAVIAAVGLPILQALSLPVWPHREGLFRRPGSAPNGQIVMTGGQVDAAVARARACPVDSVYSGEPLIAFLADRRMPDDQPDIYITTHASRFHAVAARMAAAQPRCP
jgi:hypothetical protein